MSVSSNAFACGSNQNCGNVITDRSTTRIHAPPGGKDSVGALFGDAEADKPVQRRQPQNQISQDSPFSQQPPQQQAPQQSRGTSSNAYATGSNQNCGNVLTDRPTTRVHAPPGGADTWTLG